MPLSPSPSLFSIQIEELEAKQHMGVKINSEQVLQGTTNSLIVYFDLLGERAM